MKLTEDANIHISRIYSLDPHSPAVRTYAEAANALDGKPSKDRDWSKDADGNYNAVKLFSHWLANQKFSRDDGFNEASAICHKWIARLGRGFHPDTRGADYSPALTDAEITECDNDIDRLFDIANDPYASALTAMQRAGLID